MFPGPAFATYFTSDSESDSDYTSDSESDFDQPHSKLPNSYPNSYPGTSDSSSPESYNPYLRSDPVPDPYFNSYRSYPDLPQDDFYDYTSTGVLPSRATPNSKPRNLNTEPISIFTFTWNTQSIRICESLDEKTVKQHRRHPFNHWSGDCKPMDFWPKLAQRIEAADPTLVAFGFQEDARPGSYAHSDLLIEEMSKLGYTLLARDKLIGAGKTSVQGISKGELVLRGLRLSVYVKSDVRDQFRVIEPNLTYTDSVLQNKGMVAIYIELPNDQILAVINAHLPFTSSTLFESVDKLDPMIRQNSVFKQNSFFNQAYRELVYDSPTPPDHVILMGDLNYRIHPPIDWNIQLTARSFIDADPYQLRFLVEKHDELKRQIRSGNIYPLKEGVRDSGPSFKPTCKVSHDRDPSNVSLDSYKLGNGRRAPSYCDRILFESISNGIELNCLNYDRFDFGNMRYSDHSGVVGLFDFGYPPTASEDR